MKLLFVDTAGWMACADAADPAHKEAIRVRDGWLRGGGVCLTTDYVVDETLTLLRMRLGLSAATEWWLQVESSSRIRFEGISVDRAEKARQLFFRFSDKDFSFTDCTSFVVMKELKLRQVLTTDRHFEQFGFDILPPLTKR